jgi:hypothetical protein
VLGGVALLLPQKPKQPLSTAGSLILEADPIAATDKSVSSQYTAAREKMLQGAFPEAERIFGKLAETAPQPTRNWCHFHTALCQLLAENGGGTSVAIQKIEPEAAEGLAPFFENVKALLLSEKSSFQQLAAFRADSFQVVALLAGGLQAWCRANASGALEAWKPALAATEASQGWAGTYRPLIEKMVQEAELVVNLPPLEGDKIDAVAILDAYPKAFTQLRPSPLKFHLETKFQGAKPKLEEIAAVQRSGAEGAHQLQVAREQDALQQALIAALPASLQMQFLKAAEPLQALQFNTPEVKSAHEAHLKTFTEAGEFLEVLARDHLSAGDMEVQRGGGQPVIRGTLLRADAAGFTLRVAGAEVVTPFSTFHPTALIQMAENVLGSPKIADSNEHYRRRQLMVSFAIRTNQNVLGQVKGRELAQEHRGFRQRWKHLRQEGF